MPFSDGRVYFKTAEEKHNEAERWVPLLLPLLPKNREFCINDFYGNPMFSRDETHKLKQVDLEITTLLIKTGKFKYSRPGGSIYHIETSGPYIPSVLSNDNPNYKLILAEHKDAVLLWLCNNLPAERHFTFNPTEATAFLEIDFNDLAAILTQFERKGLLRELNISRYSISLTLNTDAHDHLNRFGFYAIEQIFHAQLEKLGIELDELKQDTTSEKQLEKINKMSSIIGTVIAGISLLKPN